MQADPLGLVDGASVYGYARGNPGRYVDFDGRKVVLVCRPIDSKILSIMPSGRHCAVFVVKDDENCECNSSADADGVIEQFSLRRGATEFDKPGNYGEVYNTDRNAFRNPNGRKTDHYLIAVPARISSCQFDKLVRSNGANFSQGSYRALRGPNSNTAADNLIENSGGIAPNTGAKAQSY